MKLSSLFNQNQEGALAQFESFGEIANLEYLLINEEEIDESMIPIIEPIKQMFTDIISTAKTIKNSANKKGELNDVVFRKLYLEEKEKLEASLENLNIKIRQAFIAFLKKHDIKVYDTSVDVKRNNAHRFFVIKLTRAVLAALGSLQDNAYESFISILFPGLGAIISGIYAAKDIKSGFQELANSKNQMIQLVKKVRARQAQ